MKFDDKYIFAEYLDVKEKDGVLKGNQLNTCWHCGASTTWLEINFQAYLCSEECVAAKWKEYEDAVRNIEEAEIIDEETF